jgi:hypothetical protein
MPTNVSEMNLEDTILAYLRDKQGYEEGTNNDYVKDFASEDDGKTIAMNCPMAAEDIDDPQ